MPFFKEWQETNATRAAFYQTRPEEELYDVVNDPYDLINLATDPKFASIKTNLKSNLEAFMKQQNDKGIETEMQALTRQPKNGGEND
jgi:N-sulfoglucosamine sulfohydrolase